MSLDSKLSNEIVEMFAAEAEYTASIMSDLTIADLEAMEINAHESAQEFIDNFHEQSYSPESRIQKRIEKKLKRQRHCGTWGLTFDPHTGLPKQFQYKCGLWRKHKDYANPCPTCLSRRATWARKCMADVVVTKKVKMITVTDAEAKTMIRKINRMSEDGKTAKKNFERFPREDGSVTLFWDVDVVDFDGGEAVDMGDVFQMDWEDIVGGPVGKNKSGTLSAPISVSDGEEFCLIDTDEIMSDAELDIEQEFAAKAVELTIGLNPKTEKELRSALAQRAFQYRKMLHEAGYTTFSLKRKLKCVFSRINWSKDTQKSTSTTPLKELHGIS